MNGASAALCAQCTASLIHQQLAHGACSDGKEVFSILKARVASSLELQEGLVDQRRSVEFNGWPRLAAALAARYPLQLLVGEAVELIDRRLFTGCGLMQ